MTAMTATASRTSHAAVAPARRTAAAYITEGPGGEADFSNQPYVASSLRKASTVRVPSSSNLSSWKDSLGPGSTPTPPAVTQVAVPWDEQIVPALRRKLEEESRILARRISGLDQAAASTASSIDASGSASGSIRAPSSGSSRDTSSSRRSNNKIAGSISHNSGLHQSSSREGFASDWHASNGVEPPLIPPRQRTKSLSLSTASGRSSRYGLGRKPSRSAWQGDPNVPPLPATPSRSSIEEMLQQKGSFASPLATPRSSPANGSASKAQAAMARSRAKQIKEKRTSLLQQMGLEDDQGSRIPTEAGESSMSTRASGTTVLADPVRPPAARYPSSRPLNARADHSHTKLATSSSLAELQVPSRDHRAVTDPLQSQPPANPSNRDGPLGPLTSRTVVAPVSIPHSASSPAGQWDWDEVLPPAIARRLQAEELMKKDPKLKSTEGLIDTWDREGMPMSIGRAAAEGRRPSVGKVLETEAGTDTAPQKISIHPDSDVARLQGGNNPPLSEAQATPPASGTEHTFMPAEDWSAPGIPSTKSHSEPATAAQPNAGALAARGDSTSHRPYEGVGGTDSSAKEKVRAKQDKDRGKAREEDGQAGCCSGCSIM